MAKFIGRPTIEGIVTLYRALMGRDMPFKQIEQLKQRAKRDGSIAPPAEVAANASSPELGGSIAGAGRELTPPAVFLPARQKKPLDEQS